MAKQKIKATKLTVGLPFNLGSLETESTSDSERVAWELYVELITRLPLKEIDTPSSDDLSFLFDIINVTRQILRQAGPSISRWPNPLGRMVIDIINKGIRPFLAKWYPLLNVANREKTKENNAKGQQDKTLFEFKRNFADLHGELIIYSEALAKLAGVE
ncbi:MAG: hypothetical protein HN392_00590 [Anaerolineae bacterium]|jgi:hypothetical protein|nr:hypothetical protein [Anaerolineae bacterium]MBT7781622.1 hypothetical protein [Anaerolineae bacterium]